MRWTHSLHKHLCALFLTAAILTSLAVVKRKSQKLGDSQINYNNLSVSRVKERFFNHNFSQDVRNGRDNKSEVIYILGLFELSTKWGNRSEGFSEMAAAQLAVRHVNNFNVLPEHKLELLINDTKCDPGVGIDTFFHAIYSRRKAIVMLLGTSCSNVTESLAHVVPYWNILHVIKKMNSNIP